MDEPLATIETGKENPLPNPTTLPSFSDQVGYVDFVIKVYFPNVEPRFPAGGKMSMHLENLKVLTD